MDKPSNRLKIIIHGCCYFSAIATVEASTILPLIVHYFTNSSTIIGIFSSLLRGGAVLMLLYAAFQAQSYKRVMPYLFRISFFRTSAMACIGLVIFLFAPYSKTLTLWLFGVSLFIFSFISGFGTIYFNELVGKIFSNEYRGVTLAYRQFFGSLGSIITGGIAAWYLKNGIPPQSFAYLFFAATLVLASGYFALNAVEEFEKTNISKRENDFGSFIKNALSLLRTDKNLRIQITTGLLSYSFLLALPFIVIHARNYMNIGGLILSSTVPIMIGGMLSNLIWSRFLALGKNKHVLVASYLIMIIALTLSLIKPNMVLLILVFFIAGCSIDGFKLSLNNIILTTAPESKRPVYVALQTNIVSLGLFFSIPGGILYDLIGFKFLVFITLGLLFLGLWRGFKLHDRQKLEEVWH
jgi:MFS family permease